MSGMAPVGLVFLHTAAVHVARFQALLDQAAPGLAAAHVVDEALLAQARALGDQHPSVVQRVQAAVRQAAAGGVRVVVCTCSTVGGVAEATPTGGAFVAARIDRAMADEAVRLGPRVRVVAALDSTLAPTATLVRDSAARQGRPVQIDTLCVPEAWAHFEAGRMAEYLACIAQAVRAAEIHPDTADADVVVLAQASMAEAAGLLGDLGRPVLSSPALGVQAALARWGEAGPPALP